MPSRWTVADKFLSINGENISVETKYSNICAEVMVGATARKEKSFRPGTPFSIIVAYKGLCP